MAIIGGLDVHRSQITFDHILAILDRVNDLGELLLIEVLGANSRVDAGADENRLRVDRADAVNVTERNINALLSRNIYTSNTSHYRNPSAGCPLGTLTLFMARIGADDPDHALAPHDLALAADFLDRGLHSHRRLLTSRGT